MSISGIGSGLSSMSLADLLSSGREEEENSILNASSTWASSNRLLGNLQNRKAQSAYGGSGASAMGQAALNKALGEMGATGAVTFKDISAYREQLEAEFSAQVRLDLQEQGVSLDTDFTISMDASGAIQVQCDDAVAKEKIQRYLTDNPDVCEQFGYIQALSNLERARQTSFGGAAALREARNAAAEMQASAVEAFFGTALDSGMNYASLMAQFGSTQGIDVGSGGVSFYAGLDCTV